MLLWGIARQLAAAGEFYYFKHFTVEDGLSQNTVAAILQDKKGFLWFGTKDGLNRYDGLSFRRFKHSGNGRRGLGNNFITALYEDTEGKVWVGTDVGIYIYDPEQDHFRHFTATGTDNVPVTRTVTMIRGDSRGHVWLAVESQGLFCYDPNARRLHHYSFDRFPFISSNVRCFAFDNSGSIWIGFYGGGLYYSEDRLQTLHPCFVPDEKEKIYNDDIVTCILPGSHNRLYIGSVKGGVKELNLTSKKLNDLLLADEKGEPLYCRNLLAPSNTELWIGTETGIYIYNLYTRKYIHLHSQPYDPYSLSDNAIYTLCKDRERGIWAGSYFGGVNYYPYPYTYFEKYYPKGTKNSLHGKRVREFCMDNRGILWIGTEDGGLNRFDPQTKEFSFFAPSAAFTNIHGLALVGHHLWVGTFTKGLKVIDTRTGTIVKTYRHTGTPRSLNDNSVFAVCKTTAGDIYLGTMFGLLRYLPQTDNFEEIPELNGKFVYDIKEDSDGNLWLATYANGAYCYRVNEKRWKNYTHDEKNKQSLSYNKVLSIFEDSRRRIWLTTQGGGVCLFHPATESFTCYTSDTGLPNDVVYQMVEDNDRRLWLTTNNGLVRFDPEAGVTKVYTTANGLLGDQFNYRSSFKHRDGTIYLGCIDGFIAFDPATFSDNDYLPAVAITDFYLFGKAVYANEKDSPLKKSITFSDRIELRDDQNSFSLRLAALGYQTPETNELMYKLEGFDEEWQPAGESPLVTYSNLRYGRYVFRTKVSNSNGVWSESKPALNIRILPPFYLSAWAYCLYALLTIGCFACTVLYVKRRTNKKHRRQTEIFEQKKEREIYHAKIDFFTNVAHEIRNPLTLIKGPLENILLKKEIDPEIRDDLHIMKQNTERLLNLTNQLLDFRKTESRGFSLNFTDCNITEVLKETHLRFTSLARQKGMEFTLEVPEHDVHAHVDREAFTKIISNLLNNAMKYAGTYVHVTLETDTAGENRTYRIRTVNDGTIVPDGMKEEIFRPFVRFDEKNDGQVTAGTGIGLALARSLAELHRGSLAMLPGEETNTFCLTLPLVQDTAVDPPAEPGRQPDLPAGSYAEETGGNDDKPFIVVVEDHADMRAFIARQFAGEYTVLTASQGAEALDILDKKYVRLVISDVMMPVMDGFELCRTIKSNLDYSHIPVILLTAKTNIQSKIAGMELGADAYIEKPFSAAYLHACATNLIQNRERLRQLFTQSPFVGAGTMALTKTDEIFIRKLKELIVQNLSNPEFSTNDMADGLNMSRSSFYRKVKGVLDLSPNDYLRLERLKKAARLLREGDNRVNEICYTVGFSSPSYFTKCFQKQFGILPKDFAG